MAAKLDLKKTHRLLYWPGEEPSLVDVPAFRFLMVDGRGDPNASPAYEAAIGALYGTAYRIKFASKQAGTDFVVPPLEGLWWAADMAAYRDDDRDSWQWTMMIAVPDPVEEGVIVGAVSEATPVRVESFEEGRSAQLMHIGPYADEAPTIERLHSFIDTEGLRRRGRHHEVYLSDPRRTAPERMRTIIRQPVA